MSEKDGSLSKIVDVASLSGEERLKYDRARKYYRDSQMFITQAYSEGKEEGLIEGEAKGINERNAYFVGQMKANGLSIEDIVKLTNMSPDEVSRYYYA
ncbi:MAG: hypothetical protein II951_09020 [Bacteroidales bacterium]|nr:hypothetical protein [Bacteroidales bacterium]